MGFIIKSIKVPDSVKVYLEDRIEKKKRRGEFTSLKRELERIVTKNYKKL